MTSSLPHVSYTHFIGAYSVQISTFRRANDFPAQPNKPWRRHDRTYVAVDEERKWSRRATDWIRTNSSNQSAQASHQGFV